MPRSFDVLIVGGSVAGSSLAIHLGRRGLRTIVCDKARFPRRKTCGEGLLPHGAAELESLGLGDPPGFKVEGLRYFSPSGESAAARFDACGLGPGWVVHRDAFDAWLLDRARSTPNVRVAESSSVSLAEAEASRASIVVGADGAHSVFHRMSPFRRTAPRRERIGLSAVARGYPASNLVDVFLGSGGEAYLGPTGTDEVSIALLLERGTKPEALLESIPALRGIELVRPFIGAGPLGCRVAPIVHGRVLLIGDAAGAVDPISGEGLSLALLSARAAAEAIHEAIESDDLGALQGYVEARRAFMEPASRMSKLLLGATRRPWIANRVVRNLARDGARFGRLLRAACGAGRLGPLETARLVL